jgi:hypothetical protein
MNHFALNTIQLQWALDKKFVGAQVCAIDKLELDENGIYIVNTDHRLGRHWVVMYVTDNIVEFFDSFGRHPKYIQNGHMFMQIIKATGKTLIVTSKRFQHNTSSVCGWYCLAYAYVRVRMDSVQTFNDMFSHDKYRNDQIAVVTVKTFYK